MAVELPADLLQLKNELTKRFVAGIRKSFSPCPLIGPKWLQGFPGGRPADLRFFGVRKLAKALGQPAEQITGILLKNVSFEGLDVDVLPRDDVIDIHQKNKSGLTKSQNRKTGAKPRGTGKKRTGYKPGA